LSRFQTKEFKIPEQKAEYFSKYCNIVWPFISIVGNLKEGLRVLIVSKDNGQPLFLILYDEPVWFSPRWV